MDEGSVVELDIYLGIILRTAIIYLVIWFLFRMMGKREVGELSVLDLVVSIMIGDIAVLSFEDLEKPFIRQTIPMFVLAFLQITLAFASLKSVRFRYFMDGKPQIIINQGKIDEKAMRRQRYNFDDLLTQLREQGIIDINEVQFAILETSGKLSVIKKSDEEGVENQVPFPLIVDGEIQEKNLDKIGKNHVWLLNQLKEHGDTKVKEISICGYIDGQFYIDKNEIKK
ncbi:DUF421 domain-containing protein [Bacillus sp. ISL-78]|uniref:DUF421 domain-containing protein n=1 Tax=Bacillus sp. ISL-57 TaxID=2819135 RepID=UPI001BEAD21E|nr:DUF421 domain-containing protein [Bacillus sp. ISL-57]MBT2616733.1 DUF421 domain-containing protein [Bacillus sp. ISL-78]MBT2631452.1 DUF421 domain-containing protein [Bacillus sp. ISL-101]MBT2718122.1 DUF421 domain-containing protein [Bacillus sp. ISL-57]